MNYGEPLQVRLPTCVARVVKFEVSYWRMGGSTHGMMPTYAVSPNYDWSSQASKKNSVFGLSHA